MAIHLRASLAEDISYMAAKYKRDDLDERITAMLDKLSKNVENFSLNPEHVTIGFYQNGNYHASCIVARTDFDSRTGNPREFAAYMSGVPNWLSREASGLWTAAYGEKLPEIMARGIFTQSPFPRLSYRD